MSKFDGVLGRSTQPIEAVPKVLSARAPGKSADPDYQKTTVYLREATTPERQDCLPEGESAARHERRR